LVLTLCHPERSGGGQAGAAQSKDLQYPSSSARSQPGASSLSAPPRVKKVGYWRSFGSAPDDMAFSSCAYRLRRLENSAYLCRTHLRGGKTVPTLGERRLSAGMDVLTSCPRSLPEGMNVLILSRESFPAGMDVPTLAPRKLLEEKTFLHWRRGASFRERSLLHSGRTACFRLGSVHELWGVRKARRVIETSDEQIIRAQNHQQFSVGGTGGGPEKGQTFGSGGPRQTQ